MKKTLITLATAALVLSGCGSSTKDDNTFTVGMEAAYQPFNWQTSKKYTSVVISCPGIAQGESYTLKAGTSKTTVTMDSLIYGTGNTMGR